MEKLTRTLVNQIDGFPNWTGRALADEPPQIDLDALLNQNMEELPLIDPDAWNDLERLIEIPILSPAQNQPDQVSVQVENILEALEQISSDGSEASSDMSLTRHNIHEDDVEKVRTGESISSKIIELYVNMTIKKRSNVIVYGVEETINIQENYLNWKNKLKTLKEEEETFKLVFIFEDSFHISSAVVSFNGGEKQEEANSIFSFDCANTDESERKYAELIRLIEDTFPEMTWKVGLPQTVLWDKTYVIRDVRKNRSGFHTLAWILKKIGTIKAYNELKNDEEKFFAKIADAIKSNPYVFNESS